MIFAIWSFFPFDIATAKFYIVSLENIIHVMHWHVEMSHDNVKKEMKGGEEKNGKKIYGKADRQIL